MLDKTGKNSCNGYGIWHMVNAREIWMKSQFLLLDLFNHNNCYDIWFEFLFGYSNNQNTAIFDIERCSVVFILV